MSMSSFTQYSTHLLTFFEFKCMLEADLHLLPLIVLNIAF